MSESKQKVGIITFHRAENFGAVLQAFALQNYIKNQGYNAEIIDYDFKNVSQKYNLLLNSKFHNSKNPLKRIRILLSNIYNLNKKITRKNNYKEFRRGSLLLSAKKYDDYEDLIDNPPLYDFYITGSDQVWNKDFLDKGEYSFYLDFVKSGIKLSYAASTGGNAIKEENLKHISRLDFISIREKSTAMSLQDKIENTVYNVCDPVFLLKHNEWNNFYQKKRSVRKDNTKYILLYNIWTDDNLIELVNEISSKLNMKVVCYNKKDKFNDAQIDFENEVPEQFLRLIAEAEYVITSSFHGTAFSIIFNKKFITSSHPSTGARMIDVLDNFGLSKRLIDTKNSAEKNIEILKTDIDYIMVNELLEKEREKAKEYLSTAFNSIN